MAQVPFTWVFLGLLAWLPLVSGQVFVLNTDKSSYSAGSDSILIKWQKSATSAIYDKLDTAKLLLCTHGSNGAFSCPIILTNSASLSDGSYTAPLSQFASEGPSGSYTIQMVALESSDKAKYVTMYLESWLQITGMTGSGSATSGSIPNDDYKGFNTNTLVWTSYTIPASYSGVSGYEIPYTWQKGPTRTAPFQSTPGSTITQTVTPTRRYPTSSYSPFLTNTHYKYMQVTTATPSPVSAAIQQMNFASSITTSPSGRQASLAIPQVTTATASESTKRKRKRWATLS